MSESRFRTIEPKILYFGTPVALISSLNEDGETNLRRYRHSGRWAGRFCWGCLTKQRRRTTCGGMRSAW
jgi:hypothetical protein